MAMQTGQRAARTEAAFDVDDGGGRKLRETLEIAQLADERRARHRRALLIDGEHRERFGIKVTRGEHEVCGGARDLFVERQELRQMIVGEHVVDDDDDGLVDNRNVAALRVGEHR